MKYSKNFSLDLKVAWYLMASYLYYEKDYSLLTDAEYDELCKELHDFFPLITHPHHIYLDENLLKCGSGFGLIYPLMTISAAERLLLG